jgi:hypothetical protein
VVTFNSGNLRTNVNSVYFDLTGVEATGYEYEPSVTRITVNSNGSITVAATRFDNPSLPWQTPLAGGSSDAATAVPSGVGAGGPSAPAAVAAADDDAYRIANSEANSIAPSRRPAARNVAVATGEELDESPIADPGAWSLYASAVDDLLATAW